MKCILATPLLALFATAAWAQEDRTITKVVKLLQGMLEKSKVDGDSDRLIFSKFQCYCDTNKASKSQEIEGLTKDIAVLSSNIQDLLGSNGELSVEVAGLKKALAENEQARREAQAIRDKENAAFEATKTDLTNAIAQMGSALDTLTEVGSDQTLAAAADHQKFLGGYSPALLKLRTTVKSALLAASAFVRPGKVPKALESFIQAPFTGSYTAQSGEVVGILKNMRDTFKSNLEAAETAEAGQAASHEKFMATKLTESDEMQRLYNEKQDQLGSNDGQLAAKRKQLADSETQRGIREEFLSQLIPLCDQKTAEYKERTMLRANEDAALSEAISILNSDAAFATFGATAAASSGATGPLLLQRMAVRLHPASPSSVRQEVLQLLRAAASTSRSLRLTEVASLLEADNPFTTVLEEITKVISLLDEEGKVDKQKLDWCSSERESSAATIDAKDAEIVSLDDAISGLTNEIEAPETGLKAQIVATNAALEDNANDQKTSTELRAEEHAAFQVNVKDLATAEGLLTSAVHVLQQYYSQIDSYAKDEAAPSVLAGEEDAHPESWEAEKGYKGQSSSGNKAIEMLEFILEETTKEEAKAREDEATALSEFETLLADLKASESSLLGSLATLKKTLAEKESDLLEKESSLRNTEAEKSAVEAYVADIKPGCDFITANFNTRETRRATEKAALTAATELLQGTPAYKSAVAAAHAESLGECQEPCLENSASVTCKACLNKVTIPAYCAGHPGTEGC